MTRTILHVDMDAFFASVEVLDRPELRGRPVVVGGDGRRGVVAAASYEARAYGVHSAMPSMRARRLCPDAVFLAGRFHRYLEVSARVMEVFRSFTPLVEPISLDEAHLDVSGSTRLFGEGRSIGESVRRTILEREGLTCSVGVASTKFVAKMASEEAKPRATPQGPVFGSGVHVVDDADVRGFLDPKPVSALWGVGPATLARLERLGVRTIGHLATTPLETVVGALGRASGGHLHALANGIDERTVEPDRAAKSIGHEETYAEDLTHAAQIRRELVRLADAVATRLRAHDLEGRTVTLKVRFGDFRTITRSTTLSEGTGSSGAILAAATELSTKVDPGAGIRLLGVSVSKLAPASAHQLAFDLGADVGPEGPTGPRGGAAPDPSARIEAESAVDAIRARFGDAAIGPATLLDGTTGLRLRRKGTAQWGPGRRVDPVPPSGVDEPTGAAGEPPAPRPRRAR